MKKFFALILSVVMATTAMLQCVSASQDYINNTTGITFSMPDHWTCTDSTDMYVRFAKNYYNTFEAISMIPYSAGTYLTTSDCDDITLKSFIEEQELGDGAIKDWVELNNPGVYGVTVSTLYSDTSRVTYGYNEYYRYERNVKINAPGYTPSTFYFTVFATVHNGYVYMFRYQRDPEINHFDDVANGLASVYYNDRHITITVNGRTVYPDTEPVIIEGRTLVPIRAVAEALGYEVKWDAQNQLVGLVKNGTGAIFGINMTSYVDEANTEYPLDVAPFISGGRTYLPLRAVSDALGADINWNPNTYTASITQ